MIKLVAATCASFLIGVLVAPRSGKQTRKQIKDYISDLKK